MDKAKKVFIGVAWPYVNGEIHIGHLAGYLLPADILARYSRLKGNQVLMVSGSDCFGTPILFEALKRKIKPKELVELYHPKLLSLFKLLGISYDLFTKTDTPLHKEIVQEFFVSLYKKGYIFKKTQEQYYSQKDQVFLPDRFIEGTCKFCGYEEARADQCDSCSKIFEPGELINPKNRLTGNPVSLKETEHYFIDWPKFEPFVKEYVAKHGKDWKDWVLKETSSWLSKGLIARAITRDTTWGIEIPNDKIGEKDKIQDTSNKSVYVWFDAVIGYYSASIEHNKNNREKFWLDKDARHYYFLGKDNLVFHTIFWPSQLYGYDDKLHLPDVVSVNQFLNFEGQKFSKSRGVSILCKDLAEKYGADEVRFYIATVMPEEGDSSFSWEDFQHKVNDLLVAKIGNLINRVLVLAKDYRGEKEAKINPAIVQATKEVFGKIDKEIQDCRFKNYTESLLRWVDWANKYVNDKAPWEIKDENKLKPVLTDLLYIVLSLRVFIAPLLPFAAESLRKSLGIREVENLSDFETLNSYVLESLQELKIKKTDPLFKKIDSIE